MLKTAVTFIFGALFSVVIYDYIFDNNLEETPVNNLKHQLSPSLKIEQPIEVAQPLSNATNEQALLDKIAVLEQKLADERESHKAEIAEITAATINELEKRVKEIEKNAQEQLNSIMEKFQKSGDKQYTEQHREQIKDINWAEKIEGQIQDFFTTHDFVEHITLNNIDCRQTLCKITYNISDKFETPHLFEYQLKNAPWHQKFSSSHSTNNQGKVILFVEKQTNAL